MFNHTIDIDGIEYEPDRMADLEYTLTKMHEYVTKFGYTKAIKSQKFIRHLHICVALKLAYELHIPKENIHFEVRLKNKNIDVGVIEDNQIKLAFSVRSQSSSIKKNFTNNVNSLQGEVVSIKSFYPDIRAGVIYLFKKNDVETKDNCLDYYLNNIPKKLMPIISGAYQNTNDRFDTGCIVIWDYDEKTNKIVLEDNLITKTFSMKNFIKDIHALYTESKLKSQFTVSDLTDKKMVDFLKPTKK